MKIADYHRPWAVPQTSWIMYQRWEKLLFMHWAFSPDQIASHIPNGLSLDTYEGKAWLGIVPFLMRDVRLRGFFPVRWVSNFPELNVRTYVTRDGKPGVYFFSLDAASPIGVYLGRNWFRLPYSNATMPVEIRDETVHYGCQRHAQTGEFLASYRPVSPVFYAEKGTLDYFLVERYCLYTTGRDGILRRGEIHHKPWPLQKAEAIIQKNTIAPFDLPHETPPILHYVDRLEVIVWPL